ncbi:hypothetical protein FF38_09594, partial [Lucilia cuprina]
MSGKDSRFKAIETDPRFKLPKKKSIRGNVDSRFKSALENDKRFSKKATIDKYGRKIEAKDTMEELQKYYNFEDEEKDSDSNSDETSVYVDAEQEPTEASSG